MLLQILSAGSFVIHEVREVRHPAHGKIFREAAFHTGIREHRPVQLHKFRKRKGIDHKLHISSGQIGCKLTGKQPGIRSGNINITVQFNSERVDTFLPGIDLLYFIKKEIYLAIDLRSPAKDC